VRAAVVAQQRALARRWPALVAEGRDTTTVVFPDAEHKFFLSASPAVRAARRAQQEGRTDRLREIQADIERRDRLDTTRAHGPLVRAPDALEIDADELGVEDVVRAILRAVRGDAPARAR
jgi:cytidylate kinase